MKAITIFKAVTKNWLRSRSGLFFSFMFPILLLIVFGAIFSNVGGAANYTLFVQNLDYSDNGQPTDLSTTFISALNSTGTFDLKDVPPEENATNYIQDQLGAFGGSGRILVISQGFQDDLINGTLKVRVGIVNDTLRTSYQYFENFLNETEKQAYENGISQMEQFYNSLPDSNTSLTIYRDPSDQSAGVVQGIIINVANAFNYEMIGAENVITFNQESITGERFKTVDFYIPGITAAFIMTNGIIALTSTNTEFKRRGIIKRLSITPLKKMDWIIGNILSQTLLNLILALVMIGVGWIIFRITVIPGPYTIAMIFLGSVMFSGIGMILSGLVKDVEAASALGNAIAFPMMFLSGTFFPLELMPGYLQTISKVLPLTYFSQGLSAGMITNNFDSMIYNIAIVAALAVVFIAIGALVTRWKEK